MKNLFRTAKGIKTELKTPPPPAAEVNQAPPPAEVSPALPSFNILDYYVTTPPSPQNAVDIFKGEWASKLPESLAGLQAGTVPSFEDHRIEWALSQLGDISGKSILELGPLEAGHTYMLEQAGASEIVAIESNTRAYLKCLIIKELLNLKRAQFLCGDFVEYLRVNQRRYDICIASGVLYHMRNPAELIALTAKVTDRLFIWTHYYDKDIISANPFISHHYPSSMPFEYQGFKHTLYRQEYRAGLTHTQFWGGDDEYSQWMSRGDILACLEYFGFHDIQIDLEQLDHIHGPAFSLVATRR